MAERSTRFSHATLREIYEQPSALADTFAAYTQGEGLRDEMWAPISDVMSRRDRLVIAASGSSRHAGMLGEIMMEEFSGIAVDVEYASEFVYRKRDAVLDPAVLVISQSGETADTLAALRAAKLDGEATISMTNVAGSSMEREADVSLVTRAGKEKAIAATKSFVTQLSLLYLMAVMLGRKRGVLNERLVEERVRGVLDLPALIERSLGGWETEMKGVAETFREAEAFLFAGRGPHYPIAREAALKLKEMSYLHAEAYPSGELKHGPNALLGPDAPLIVLATRDERDPMSMVRYEKTVQLLSDIEGQQSHILAIASEGDTQVRELCRSCVYVPAAPEFQLPFLEIVPLQMFAYFMSVQRGNDVDRPRNLVKAVVVE
jgi:glucosamine--fructose-6-phosphate aminotransferase (isomerizing)